MMYHPFVTTTYHHQSHHYPREVAKVATATTANKGEVVVAAVGIRDETGMIFAEGGNLPTRLLL
eukprot:scaffold4565_cov74-Cylindrotheca_fusiformis.AAC.4